MAPADSLLDPVDRLRRAALRALVARVPVLRPFWSDRERRVAWLGAAVLASALLGAVACPLALIAIGPVVLGVPHLLADVRYLLVGTRLATRVEVRRALWLPLLAVTVVPHAWVGLLAVVTCVAVARAPMSRRCAMGAAALAVVGLAAWWPDVGDPVFAHLHNAIAVGWLLAWRPLSGARRGLALAFGLGCAAVGLAGTVVPFGEWWGQSGLMGSGVAGYLDLLAPPALGAWRGPLIAMFAFAQSVHYGIWLRLIPEEARARPAPRSFRASFAALQTELGSAGLWLFGVLAIGLAFWGCFALSGARNAYFWLATGHGYLELGVAAVLWLERRRPSALA